MNFYEELQWRGLIHDVTDPRIEQALNEQQLTFYLGADPTGNSLHVGHLAVYMLARRLVSQGHKAILLIGGATGLVGDPGGKSGERQLLTLEKSLENAEGITKQVKSLFDVEAVVNNYDWLSKIDMITFLRDYGKNFNLNYMINKETVKSRLDTGISYTEFSYQILQSIDWHHLFIQHGCNMQIGGQDQWGNITAGIELIRKLEGHEAKVYGLTMPLVTKADGTKFGKSESGSVWLDPEQTSPYAFYQFWINASDADALQWLKKFTLLSVEDIKAIELEFLNAPHERLAHKKLAQEMTTYVHGKDAYNQAVRISESLFSGNTKSLNAQEIKMGFQDLLGVTLTAEMPLVEVLIQCKLAQSKREAREFIQNGAVAVNGDRVTELDKVLTKQEAIEEKYMVLRRGKKNYSLVEFV